MLDRPVRSLAYASLVVVFGLSVLSCGDSQSAKCTAVRHELTEGPLTIIADLKLLKAGDTMVLAGLDGDTVRWGRLAADGTISDEASFALPARAQGPWFALAGNGGTANQLLAVYGAPRAANPDIFEVSVIAQTVGGAPGTPTVIFETLPGTDLATVKFTVGTSPSGSVASLAVGFPSLSGTPAKMVFFGGGPNGGVSGTPLDVTTPEEWRCLGLSQASPVATGATTALFWLRVKPSLEGSPAVEIAHLGDDATKKNTHLGTAEIATEVCPILAPTDSGYVYAWQTKNGGTTIAPFDLGIPPNSLFVDAAVDYGGPANQPKLSGVAGMSFNTAVLFAFPTVPKVALFSPFGEELGKRLTLPSTKGADIGPISVASSPNVMRLTYREAYKETANTGPRHFVTVQCPIEK